MKFAFNLDFNELPEELQEQKIDEWITFNFEDEQWTDENEKPLTLEEALNDEHIREDTRFRIEAHFPIYF